MCVYHWRLLNKSFKIMSKTSKSKRIKLECIDCGSVFNNDYKLKHQRVVHNGKQIKTKHFGAPRTPSDVAKKLRAPTPSFVSICFFFFLNLHYIA